jgi:hypothetical protein
VGGGQESDSTVHAARRRHQTIDHGRWRDDFTENFGCGVCLTVCLFSVAGYEAIQTRFRGNPTAPRFLLSGVGDG